MPSDPVHIHRSRIALATRRGKYTEANAARCDLTAAKLERAIHAALAADHPPTADQRARLAALLSGGAR